MEVVKINFWGLWPDYDVENNNIVRALSKNFKVCISDTPDFVFFSYWLEGPCPFKDCIKIFYSQEAHKIPRGKYNYVIASHDAIDLTISKYLNYQRTPIINESERLNLSDILANRKFCNFIYSNDRVGNNVKNRIEFCKLLAQYKHVDCPGRVLNNMQNAITPRNGNWFDGKLDFIKNYKFTIAFENTILPGYTTEKIYQPFMVNSVPIYLGDPNVLKNYNPNAFINVADYKSFEEVVERIKLLDNDDELYMQMLREPVYIRKMDYEEKLEKFLCKIVNSGNTPFNRMQKAFFIQKKAVL